MNTIKNQKIVVFGATGGTGYEITKQLLQAGNFVTVIVRNPDSFSMVNGNLTVVKGDVFDSNTFDQYLQGCDVVLSALGNGTKLAKTTVYSEGIKNIIAGMNKNGVKRLICVSAGGIEVNDDMGLVTKTLTKYILQKILKEPYADMAIMESTLQQSSLDYTIVRPARLTSHYFTNTYRTAINSHIKNPGSIGKADLADYMIQLIDKQESFNTIAEISY
jgi:putative NADH-flavin reductase